VTRTTLAFRSASYFWRAHLLTLLTAALSTAILTGALLVGDSVRHSLRAMALDRLGTLQHVLVGGDRFFRDDLAERLKTSDTANPAPESIIIIQGIGSSDATQKRASSVQILGVRDGFWKLGSHAPENPPKKGEVVLNAPLAERLGAKVGEDIKLRIYKPSQLSHDAPLGADEDNAVLLRAKVSAILPARGLGRFGFDANQIAPMNAYLPLTDVQEKINQKGRANILLVSSPTAPDLRAAWSLDDGSLKLRTDDKLAFVELSTSRVFLDDAITTTLFKAHPGSFGIATYFVNGLRVNGKETPYSMVTAAPAPLTPTDMKPDQIVLNAWAAEDLGAKTGDALELEYFTVGLRRKLETNKAKFTVHSVVPIEGVHADRGLMPEFPGIAEVDTTHDWDSSIPIDMGKIRTKDDDYWKKYRGTPKAFIALDRGTKMWRNRFGTYTAVRIPLKGDSDYKTQAVALSKIILSELRPEDAGLSFTPLRELALKASGEALDFGGLFIGFSFFLIVAALLLLSLVFRFTIETRAGEAGLLLALGFTPRAVRTTLWLEGTLLAAIGGVAGVAFGMIYARAMIENLGSRWRDAVGTSALEYHGEPLTLALGGVISVVVASITIYLSVRGLVRSGARELLASNGLSATSETKFARGRWLAIGVVGLIGAIGLSVFAASQGSTGSAAPTFFGAGGALLLAALAVVRLLLNPASSGGSVDAPSLSALGIRAATRRAGRSAATALLLACGTFLVLSVGANRLDASLEAGRKESGTGGFALLARSTIPIYEDLNTVEGRGNAGVRDEGLKDATLYPFRVRAGDEASCLNLNRAQRPRIMSVPNTLIERGGFTFAAQGAAEANPWRLLLKEESDGAIPAIGDFQSLTWALGLKVGDTISVPDEKGAERKLRIVGAVANSILQGSLLIGEDAFLKLYPTENGYREFLIDAPQERSAAIAEFLETALADEGVTAVSAARRLAEFNAVQNTYLSTFQALGGLGMLLGSFGLGLVVLRNVLERRGELALLQALGFSRGAVRWIVLSEHLWLLALGLMAGVAPALLAVLPAARVTTLPVPWGELALTVGGIAACGALAALLAVYVSLRQPLLGALRNE